MAGFQGRTKGGNLSQHDAPIRKFGGHSWYLKGFFPTRKKAEQEGEREEREDRLRGGVTHYRVWKSRTNGYALYLR